MGVFRKQKCSHIVATKTAISPYRLPYGHQNFAKKLPYSRLYGRQYGKLYGNILALVFFLPQKTKKDAHNNLAVPHKVNAPTTLSGIFSSIFLEHDTDRCFRHNRNKTKSFVLSVIHHLSSLSVVVVAAISS